MFTRIRAWYWHKKLKTIVKPKKTTPRKIRQVPAVLTKIEPWDIENLNGRQMDSNLISLCELHNWELKNWSPNRAWFHWPNVVSFHDSVQEFMVLNSSPEEICRTDIRINFERTKDWPSIAFKEYEREDPRKRIGSGETAILMTVSLPPESFFEIFQRAEDLTLETESTSIANKAVLMLVAPYNRVSLPAGRSIKPDHKLRGAFSHSAVVQELGIVFLRMNERGKVCDKGDGFSTFSDINQNYDVLEKLKLVFENA